jgi:4,5-dihydroxyphthalate decarboxylase
VAITVRLAVRDWDYLTPLLLGEVQSDTIKLELTRVNTLVDHLENSTFDGGEMSLSRYSQRCAQQDMPLVGVPHFLMRGFRHRCIITRKDSPLHTIADLAGKRIGLTGWQDSGNTWTRAILRQQGISINDASWFVGRLTGDHPIVDRLNGFGRPGRIEACPGEEPMMDMLEHGRLDAVFTPFMPTGFFAGDSLFRPLLTDYPTVESTYFHQHGYVPGIHLLALKPEVLQQDPQAAEKISALFQQASALWLEKRSKYADTTPWILDEIARVHRLLPANWDAQGLAANYRMLQDWCTELQAQEIINMPLSPEFLFPQITL